MKKMLLFALGLLFMGVNVSVNANSTLIFSDVLNGKEIVRYENYLVYYAYNSTGKSPANQWGYEISVNKDNMVVECNTNVTILPGGYAISGHGTKVPGLKNVKVGDIVEIDFSSMAINLYRDEVKSSLFLSKSYLEQANDLYQKALQGKYDFDVEGVQTKIADINSKYQTIKTISEKENPTSSEISQVKSLANQVMNLGEDVIYMTSKSNPLEVRALWHRPNASYIKEDNLLGVQNFVKKVAELGFNTIYVETYWNGFASYRSEILDTHPQVASFYYGEEYKNDYIAALIGEANKLGIDVHAWCHTFNAGSNDYKAKAVLDQWLVEDYQGRTLHPNTYGGSYYLDPSNEEVLEFLESVFVEMTSKYNFAGIQFDYIRYYDNNYNQNPIRDSGYGDLPESKFKDAYNLEGDVRTLILNSTYRNKWNEWRQNNITEAVGRFSKAIRAINKNIIISADVVSDINYAKSTYMQDWKTWVDRGYIDLLCPMIYTGSSDAVYSSSVAIKNSLKNLTFLSSGIAPIYYGYSTLTNHYQIQATSTTGGSAFFASQNVVGRSDVEDSLKIGSFRKKAISPLKDTSYIVSNITQDLIDYTNKYLDGYVHHDMFIEKLNDIKNNPCNNPSDYQMIYNKLLFLSNLTGYIEDENIRANFKGEVDNLMDVIDIKISRELIALGFYDPSNGPRPDPNDFTYPEVPNNNPDDNNNEEPTPNEEEVKKGCFSGLSISFLSALGLILVLVRRKEA